MLLHGAASNHTRWSEFLDETVLKDTWNVLRPDLRGNGESMIRGQLDLEVWCDDLAELIAASGQEDAVLVGHSLGAQIAMVFAHRYRSLCRGLILIDPVFPVALVGKRRRSLRMRPLIRLAVLKLRVLNALGIHRRTIPDRDLRELDEETRAALRQAESFEEIAKEYSKLGPILKHMPVANYLQQMLAMAAPLPPLAEIQVPVVVLLSAGVTFADPEINAREIARFPAADVVEINANHWPLTERPREVRRAIETWVDSTFPL